VVLVLLRLFLFVCSVVDEVLKMFVVASAVFALLIELLQRELILQSLFYKHLQKPVSLLSSLFLFSEHSTPFS
jgi:hypothetical protein